MVSVEVPGIPGQEKSRASEARANAGPARAKLPVRIGIIGLVVLLSLGFTGCQNLLSSWTFTLTYNANGATSGTVPIDSNGYLTGDIAAVSPNSGGLAKTGASFAGWNTTNDGSGITYPIHSALVVGKASVTLYALWTTAQTYTVIYNANGGSGTVPTDSNAYLPGGTATVLGQGSLARSGYAFGGWNTTIGGTGIIYPVQSPLMMGSAPVTLYAIWNPVPTYYSVTYDGNGFTGGSVPSDTHSYLSGEIAVVLGNTGNLAKAGATFGGWNTESGGSGTPYSAQLAMMMGSVSVTLYAIWIPTYSVTYDANLATSGMVPVDSNGYPTGDVAVVPGNTGALLKTGFIFAGWNTKANGSGTTYLAQSALVFGSSSMTLYALWQ